MWTEKYVIKRKGTYRPFEFYKIEDAVQQEFLSEERPVDPQVWETILHELQTHEVWAVEDIQNLIEWTLFDSGEFDVLRPFMLYRHNRKMQREHIHKLNQYTTYIDSTQTIEEYIQETDWRINANANTSYSNARLVNNTAGKVIANYWLDKVYSPLGQSPFTNITLDWNVSEDLQDQMPTRSDKHLFEGIEDFALQEIANQRGVAKLEDLRFAHFQKEMDLINKAYYTVMTEGGANVQPFIFPIPRVNIIEDFDWESENCDLLFEKTAKIGSSYFQNFIGSQYILDEEGNRIANPEAYTPNAVRSMCCRLQLDQRKGFLEGVVLSGRECTLHKDIIPAIREIKEMELAVKIDTHGSRPELVSTLYRERLIDYVALGFKALSRSYLAVTASDLYTSFVETLDLLLASDIKFEILTIVHSQLISLDDLLEMKQYLKGRGYRGDYFIQYFVDDKTTIGSLEPTYRFRDLSQWDDDQIRFVVRN